MFFQTICITTSSIRRVRAAGLILFTRIRSVRSCTSGMRSCWRILLESLAMNEIRCVLVLVGVLFFGACGGGTPTDTSNSSPAPAGSPTPAPSPLTGFEKDLQYIRNGGYTYVWIFSRKDGKPLDKEDGRFLRTNAPQVVDWV